MPHRAHADRVDFFLNGRAVTVHKPAPDLLLVDYLRSPDVALAGPKKPCGQGGCGGCTVILSRWNQETASAEHSAVNSCLRPVLALNGLVVTTIEGTGSVRQPNPDILPTMVTSSRSAQAALQQPLPGLVEGQAARVRKLQQVKDSVDEAVAANAPLTTRLRETIPIHPTQMTHEGMNPVAWRLAMNNGTQCGYCTVGFVMNMSEFLANNPMATKRDIEGAMDGNLCRCTGYRAILTGMKTFASDWTEKDEEERMKCRADAAALAQRPTGQLVIPFPPEARQPPSGVTVNRGRHHWLSPTSLAELLALMVQHAAQQPRLVGANTAFGIYPAQYLAATVLLDLRYVAELNSAPRVDADGLHVAASTTYTSLIALLNDAMLARGETEPGPDGAPVPKYTTRLGAISYMAKRTAGRIVRNAATLGGNTMLVLHHIHSGSGAPFPSDAVTAMVAAGVEVDYAEVSPTPSAATQRATLAELVERAAADPGFASRLVLVAYHIPFGPEADVLYPQKVALREVNAHSIVNATTRLRLGAGLVVDEALLVFGAIAPYPWRARATERAMQGKPLALADMATLAPILRAEVEAELLRWAARTAEQPSEGFSDAYRVSLCLAYLYKAIVNALMESGAPVPPEVRSSGLITWDRWTVSNGLQSYKIQEWKHPVSQPFIKYLAMEQASGQVHYTHELSVPPQTVNASFVQSTRALASWQFSVPGGSPADAGDVEALRAHLSQHHPDFVDIITSACFKDGAINLQGMGMDQPIFAIDTVQYVGQSLALICAKSEEAAASIADYVTRQCVRYGPVTIGPDDPQWWGQPVLDLDQAIAVGSIYPDYPTTAPFNSHIWKVTRPGSQFDWADTSRAPLDKQITNQHGMVGGVPCQIIGGTQTAGGQAHFYMEGQAAIAEPIDARRMIVRPSTQSPMEMHATAVLALGAQYNRIGVEVPPVGGGFGGKTEQAKFVAGAAAAAAGAIKGPVRLTMTREQDTAMIGKRHAYYGQYQLAIDRGEVRAADKGIIQGFLNKMWGDGGAFYDCSFIVSNCIQVRADNAYKVANFENQIDVCRTNTAPSTAFRAFGDIQSKIITENAIDDAAFAIGMSAEDVRYKNMYVPGDVTPYGQALTSCYIREVWDYLKDKSNYDEKVKQVEAFNRANRWRKQGLAMIPVKYGSGYNLAMLEQASVVLSIYSGDGTIVIQQGGVEMGQGLLTQVRQIAAYVLDIPMAMIQVESANTGVIPNPTSTGGSTGTAYNGEAVKRVCQLMRSRLIAFADQLRLENGPEWCQQNGIDYWNHGARGWGAEVTIAGKTHLIWQNLIALAYQYRIGLVASFTAPIAGADTPTPALTYKPIADQPTIPGATADPNGQPGSFDNFVGFTFSAACSVVEVDILTGEVKILSADLAYDMGWSLNPAIDIGQVEGAFVQGIGYLLSEKLVFQPDGDAIGTLNTLNTWTYKIPAVSSIPLAMHTHLFPRDLVKEPSMPTEGVLSSKEVGEPPLVLASSVFFAVKAAIRASRLERGLDGLFRLDAPATVQEVQRACAVDTAQFDY